jgi:WD40 repeat protein
MRFTLRQLMVAVTGFAILLGIIQILATISKLSDRRKPINEIRSVTYSPDGKRLAAFVMNGRESGFSYGGPFDATHSVVVFEIPRLSKLAIIKLAQREGPEGHIAFVNRTLIDLAVWQRSVVFGPDANSVTVVDPDAWQIRTWDIASGHWSADEPVDESAAIALGSSPSGEMLAVATLPSMMTVWNAKTGNKKLTRLGWSIPKFSQNGTRLALATAQGVEVWSVEPEKLLATFTEDKEKPSPTPSATQYASRASPCFAISSDGETVAIAHSDALRLHSVGTAKQEIISPEKFKVRHTFGGTTIGVDYRDNTRGLTFSPDGKYFAAWGVYGVRVFDVSKGYSLLRRTTHSTTLCLAFSPDGKTYATGDKYGEVAIWDVTTGKAIRSVKLRRAPR